MKGGEHVILIHHLLYMFIKYTIKKVDTQICPFIVPIRERERERERIPPHRIVERGGGGVAVFRRFIVGPLSSVVVGFAAVVISERIFASCAARFAFAFCFRLASASWISFA